MHSTELGAVVLINLFVAGFSAVLLSGIAFAHDRVGEEIVLTNNDKGTSALRTAADLSLHS